MVLRDLRMMIHKTETPQVVIVTGYSGAGKSTVLRALEDASFFCIDNLPSALIGSFFQLIANSGDHTNNFALGLDIRSRDTIQEIVAALKNAYQAKVYAIKIIFLTASDKVLLKRFQETRRKHPLAKNRSIQEAIALEKKELAPLIDSADTIISTGQFTAQQLRQIVTTYCAQGTTKQLVVNLVSFGFKYGMPSDCNFVYDVRSLPNPYFVTELQHCNGTEQPIHDYLFSQKEVKEYWKRLVEFFRYSIEKSYYEGRFFITVAVGCTGGRHRSVAFIHELAQQKLDNVVFMVKHRDINRDLI